MTDPFETLIHQLSLSLKIPLHLDHHRACAIQISKQTIQIQIDSSQEHLLIASFICEILPGKFRENVLNQALKANNLPDPRVGVLSYLPMSNRLSMHQRYPFLSLNGEKLAEYIAGFVEYASIWREAIEKGQISPAPVHLSGTSNPFGLKR